MSNGRMQEFFFLTAIASCHRRNGSSRRIRFEVSRFSRANVAHVLARVLAYMSHYANYDIITIYFIMSTRAICTSMYTRVPRARAKSCTIFGLPGIYSVVLSVFFRNPLDVSFSLSLSLPLFLSFSVERYIYS